MKDMTQFECEDYYDRALTAEHDLSVTDKELSVLRQGLLSLQTEFDNPRMGPSALRRDVAEKIRNLRLGVDNG